MLYQIYDIAMLILAIIVSGLALFFLAAVVVGFVQSEEYKATRCRRVRR